MRFELSEALINQLLFSMEDQDLEWVLDTFKLLVISEDAKDESDIDEASDQEFSENIRSFGEDSDRYIPIPHWQSSDGFRLMERFASSLRNPPVRAKLTEALERGRGVFRAFKDTLSHHPEVEKLWFAFKEREMRRVILNWYNALRDEWGLKRIGVEPEETADLVLEDFRFNAGLQKDLDAANELYDLRNSKDSIPKSLTVSLDKAKDLTLNKNCFVLAVETSRGDLAGVGVAIKLEPEVLDYHVVRLEIVAEYRGLGLGEELLDRLIKLLPLKAGARVFIDLPFSADQFSHVLDRMGFAGYETRYRLMIQ